MRVPQSCRHFGLLLLWLGTQLPSPTTVAADGFPASLTATSLHNVFRLATNVLSGSSPDDEAGFEELRRLGVTTIISVDGARPDVETAHRHGMRYVHLPIGYDGLSSNRWVELAKASESASGSIYVHCHHGKHRGPAAAAILCQADHGWTTNQALTWLRQAGTAADYAGLFRSVANFQQPDAAALAAIKDLPEVAVTSSLVESMVAIDSHTENLKAAQGTGWKEVPGHPDITPSHEASLLWEQFRELNRHSDTRGKPAEYHSFMADAEAAAQALQASLKDPGASHALDPERAFQSLTRSCTACHKPYRN